MACREILLGSVSILTVTCAGAAQAVAPDVPFAWTNATPRSNDYNTNANASSSNSTIVLPFNSIAGIELNDSAIGGSLPSGATVTALGQNTVTISVSNSVSVAATTDITFRHLPEFACLWGVPLGGQPTCSSTFGTWSANGAKNINVVNVPDQSLHTATSFAAFYGPTTLVNNVPQDIFANLVSFATQHGMTLAVTVGAPVGINGNSCLGTVGTAGSGISTTDISSIITTLTSHVPTILSNGQVVPRKIYLDLDEPLTHAYYTYAQATGTLVCPVATLAQFEASVLVQFQKYANAASRSDLRFAMGDTEEGAHMYDSPTFANGELTSFANTFSSDVASYSASQGVSLTADQEYLNFFFLDGGFTHNGWQSAATAIDAQLQSSNGGSSLGLPAFGYDIVTEPGPTTGVCPQTPPSAYISGPFCVNDAASVAASQADLGLLYDTGQPILPPAPQVLRFTSYGYSSPENWLPETDPSSMTGLINYFGNFVQGNSNPETVSPYFRLDSLASSGPTDERRIYTRSLQVVANNTSGTNPGYRIEYPLGDIYTQVKHELVGLQVFQFPGNVSYFLSTSSTPPARWTGLQKTVTVGAVHDITDVCTLYPTGSATTEWTGNDCFNRADVPVYGYYNTNPPFSSSQPEFYYTLSPSDTVASSSGWTEMDENGNDVHALTPIFYMQPNFPLLAPYTPLGYNSGLVTGSGGPTFSIFGPLSTSPISVGFQPYAPTPGDFLLEALSSGQPPVDLGSPAPCSGNGLPPSVGCKSETNSGIATITPAQCALSKYGGVSPGANGQWVVGEEPIVTFGGGSTGPTVQVYTIENNGSVGINSNTCP